MNEYQMAAWILSHPGSEVDIETIEAGDGREFYKVVGIRSDTAFVLLDEKRKHAPSRQAALVEFLKEITAALSVDGR